MEGSTKLKHTAQIILINRDLSPDTENQTEYFAKIRQVTLIITYFLILYKIYYWILYILLYYMLRRAFNVPTLFYLIHAFL